MNLAGVEKRHKCNRCAAVRYESKMKKLDRNETNASWQWANDEKCWACKGKCWKI